MPVYVYTIDDRYSSYAYVYHDITMLNISREEDYILLLN